jgi:hypothetical protein
VAAHIHAAARGGKRYLETMTPEQRKDISNAIWLCTTHGTLVDQDEVKYPADLLRAWKRQREIEADAAHARGRNAVGGAVAQDLIAIGPDVIVTGELVGSSGSKWTIEVETFVMGDRSGLIKFGERFAEMPEQDRYVLLDSMGDGRVLQAAPSWKRMGDRLVVDVDVRSPVVRKRAQDLGRDLALTEDGDIFTKDGHMATISGLAALPQKVRACLSFQKGEDATAPEFGARVSEFYALYKGSPWIDRLCKLEAIRMAAIPCRDSSLKDEYTPLQCVNRVLGFQLLEGPKSEEWSGRWCPARITAEVKGVGLWTADIKVFVDVYPRPPAPPPPHITGAGPRGSVESE